MDSNPSDLVLHDHYLLLLIFETLLPLEPPDRRLLAHCARVCRAFYEPASNVQWRRLNSLHPCFLVLIPAILSPDTPDRGQDYEKWAAIVAAQSGGLDNWPHFLRCCARIRELKTPWGDGPLTQALIDYAGGTTFLPSLRKLVWGQRYSTDIGVARLIPSCLIDLEIHLDAPYTGPRCAREPDLREVEPDLDALFDALVHGAPSLRRLALKGGTRSWKSPAVPLIARLGQLHELTLEARACPVDPASLRTLVKSMPNLRTLACIPAKYQGAADISTNSREPITAPRLRSLHFPRTHADDVTGLLSQLAAPAMHTLSVRFRESADVHAHPRCFEVIAAAPMAASLRSLSLSLYVPAAGDLALLDLLRPLLALRALTACKITVYRFKYGFGVPALWGEMAAARASLTDADVRTIARAWPHLTTLALAWAPGASPTLAALAHIADACAGLRALRLSHLGFTADGRRLAVPASRSARHPLETLEIENDRSRNALPPGAAERVARYIEGMFPNLAANRICAPRSESGRWGEIVAAIRKRRDARGVGVATAS